MVNFLGTPQQNNLMEKQNIKGSYLQYFPHTQSTHKRIERPKMLPHIIEEYQYRITNHLLIKKIISPKRDKIIINSLEKIKRSNRSNTLSKSKGLSRDGKRCMRQFEGRNNKSEHRLKTAEEKHKSSASFCTAELVNSLKGKGKMQIIKNQFQKEDSRCDEAKSGSIFYRSLYQKRPAKIEGLPQTFGCGPTILSIIHIEIISNPPIKKDVLMQLQLVEKSGLNGSQGREEKVVRTHPIAFDSLPKRQQGSSKVKFALKISKIGDFVPLRLWKYTGVECSEVGTVDIPLTPYRFSLSQTPQQNNNIQWQIKQGCPQFGRLVFQGQVNCQLRRSCFQEMQAKVILHYKIYSKRFTRITMPQTEI